MLTVEENKEIDKSTVVIAQEKKKGRPVLILPDNPEKLSIVFYLLSQMYRNYVNNYLSLVC